MSDALSWQVGVWDTMSEVYRRDIDPRFAPVVAGVLERAELAAGERVLDLGTGTGSVAELAAKQVGADGRVVAADLSTEMLAIAQGRFREAGLDNVTTLECRAEEIGSEDASFDVVLASLSLMYVIDRDAAAREVARVLRPGGRFVAAVWSGPDDCDIVLFQATAGRFAGPPPAPGVGPGALADPTPFIAQLGAHGIDANVEREVTEFDFPDFASAWDTLAAVTAAGLGDEDLQAAKAAVKEAMYPQGDGPRHFRNTTPFIIGRRA